MHMSKAIQFEVEKRLEMSLSGGERNHASTFNVQTNTTHEKTKEARKINWEKSGFSSVNQQKKFRF